LLRATKLNQNVGEKKNSLLASFYSRPSHKKKMCKNTNSEEEFEILRPVSRLVTYFSYAIYLHLFLPLNIH
jgi:hypothetical protein